MDNYDERVDLERVESELRQCLEHVPAPEGFADRVMERVAAKGAVKAKVLRFPSLVGAHRRAGWWSAIAAALLLAVGGDLVHLHRVREAQKQAEAQQQVDLAMELTNHALGQVGDSLERSHAARFTQIALQLSK